MSADLSANVGLANNATKQYAVARQVQSNSKKIDDESALPKEKGGVYGEKIVDMANPNIDEYVTALATQDEVSKAKKKYQPTLESLKERLEGALEDRYDNAHNMLAEAFYGFKVNTCNSLLGMLGADIAELESIKKKAYEQAKGKVQAGYERLATAYAEYEIYAS
jgi:hypothetical protein